MSLRELAPHGTAGDSSASSSARAHPSAGSSSTAQTSGDQGESGGGAGGSGRGGGGGRPPGKGDDGSSRRRRGAGSVSQKACDACRHARQKVSVFTLQVALFPFVLFPPSLLSSLSGHWRLIRLYLFLFQSVTESNQTLAPSASNARYVANTSLIPSSPRTP